MMASRILKATRIGRIRPATWMSLLVVGLAGTTAVAQAPRHAPPPHSLWSHSGRKVQPVSSHELWGDVYCSGGSMCFHAGGCGPLHCAGQKILRVLDCLFPCSHCGSTAGCDCQVRRVRPRHCCLPAIPSIRFHPVDCCHRGGCDDHPMYLDEAPTLIEPPAPEPTRDAPKTSAQRSRRRSSPRVVRSRLRRQTADKPVSSKPARQAKPATTKLRPASFQQPASVRPIVASDDASDTKVSSTRESTSSMAARPNPLRPQKRR